MRGITFSILVSLALLGCGCDKNQLPDANVRFENIMYDHYIFPYGLMFGDAVFGGALGYNERTSYQETKPGSYSILARRVDGEWIEISEGNFHVFGNLSYTIVIFGTIDKLSFQLTQD